MEDIVIEDCSALPQLTRIELPCFMKNKTAMLSTLGGEDIVTESLQSDANQLHANLPEDEQGQGQGQGHGQGQTNLPNFRFQAKPVISNGFLIKIRRKKKKIINDRNVVASLASDALSVSATVVGQVSTSYLFNIPIGCQFLKSVDLPAPSVQQDEQEIQEQIQLEVVPHRFPGRYLERSQDLFDDRETYIQTNKVRYRTGCRSKRMKFEIGMTMPSETPNNEYLNKEYAKLRKFSRDEMRKVVLFLESLFVDKPMWTKPQITECLTKKFPDLNSTIMDLTYKQFLPSIAFFFVCGPWKKCWTRIGYDPTLPTNADSRFLQVESFRYTTRDFSNICKSVSCGRAGQRIVNLDTLELEAIRPTSMVNDFSDTVIEAFGGVQITRQFNVQLSDAMKVPDFETFLKDCTHVDEIVDASTGWFTDVQILEFRNKVKAYIVRQASAFYEKESQQPASVLLSNAEALKPSFELLQQSRVYAQKRSKSTKGLGRALQAAAESGTLKRGWSTFEDDTGIFGGSGSSSMSDNISTDDTKKKRKPRKVNKEQTPSESGDGKLKSQNMDSQLNSSWSSLQNVDAFDIFGDDDIVDDDDDDDDDEDDDNEDDMTGDGGEIVLSDDISNFTEI